MVKQSPYASVGTQELGDEIVALAARIHAATQRLLAMIAEFDERQGWKAAGRTSCVDWLSCHAGIAASTAYEHVRVASALRKLPVMDRTFGRGQLSYSQVRAMTRGGLATPDNEQELVDTALTMSGEELELLCRGMRIRDTADGLKPPERFVKERTVGDGTVELVVRVTADEAELLRKAMREVMTANRREDSSAEESASDGAVESDEEEHRDQRRADAMVQLARIVLSGWPSADKHRVGRPSGAERTMLLVHMQVAPTTVGRESSAEESLVSRARFGAALHESGHPLSPAALERLACDCSFVVASTDARGNVLCYPRLRRGSLESSQARSLRSAAGRARSTPPWRERFRSATSGAPGQVAATWPSSKRITSSTGSMKDPRTWRT